MHGALPLTRGAPPEHGDPRFGGDPRADAPSTTRPRERARGVLSFDAMGWPSGRLAERLHVAEVARLLGVSTKTLRRWDRDGTLPAQRDARNGYRFYSRAAVARFAAARERTLGELPRSRDALLREASERLARREVVWLTGPPGSGKTWLSSLVARGFGEAIELGEDEARSEDAWARVGADALVRVDDVEEVEALAAWLAGRPPRPVLITTRRVSAPNALVVGYLDRDERLAYLRERAPDVPSVTSAAIAQTLEGFPPWLDRAIEAIASSATGDASTAEAAIAAAYDDLDAMEPVARAVEALSEPSRRALASLSVISGPFTIDGAAELMEVEVAEARATLDALVERSCVARRGSTLLVYEPLKRAAGRRAGASTSTRARSRADARLLARAHEERDRLASAEVDDLIDAAERASTTTDVEAFVRAIPPWTVRGPHVARLRALAARDVALPPPLDAELSVLEGDLERATARLVGPPSSHGRATAERALTSAYVARRRGDHAEARAWLTEVVAHGPSALRARALNELAAGLYLDGRVRASATTLEEASTLASREELTPLRAAIASNLANARADLGDLDAARRSAEEAFALAVDERARAITLAGIARLALERGDAEEAERTIAQVRRTGVPAEDVGLRSFVRRLDAWLAHHRGDVDATNEAFDEAAAIAHTAGETHLFGRARVEHALCSSAHDPARAWALSRGVPGTLAAAVSKAARIALDARAIDPVDEAHTRAEREREQELERDLERQADRHTEHDSSTVDERCQRLLALLDPRVPLESAWSALRLTRRAAMTRAAVSMLRTHAPDRLAFVHLGDRDVLVGDQHVDLRRAPVLWRVLTSVTEAGEAGIDPDALLVHGWPDERLVRRRAIHRVHGRVRELRALGVPIELVAGRYRLALPLVPIAP